MDYTSIPVLTNNIYCNKQMFDFLVFLVVNCYRLYTGEFLFHITGISIYRKYGAEKDTSHHSYFYMNKAH